MLLIPAPSPFLQLFFQIAQRRLPASASRSDIENRSSCAEGRCSEKIQSWSEFPQIRAKDCAGAHDQVADQIVRTYHLTAFGGVAVSDDERLARCVAKFLQSADRKCDDQSGKTARHQQTDWKKREHDEGHDHEWLAAISIGVMRRGNDT